MRRRAFSSQGKTPESVLQYICSPLKNSSPIAESNRASITEDWLWLSCSRRGARPSARPSAWPSGRRHRRDVAKAKAKAHKPAMRIILSAVYPTPAMPRPAHPLPRRTALRRTARTAAVPPTAPPGRHSRHSASVYPSICSDLLQHYPQLFYPPPAPPPGGTSATAARPGTAERIVQGREDRAVVG